MDLSFLFPLIELVVSRPLESLVGLMALMLVLMTVVLLWVVHRSLRAAQKVTELQHQAAKEPALGIDQAAISQGALPETSRVRVAPGRTLRRSLDELLEIEEGLLGLRELYWRRLIPIDVYVRESLKLGSRLKA
jgi:hypothetical protein